MSVGYKVGGYIMFDCDNLVINSSESQTKDGIYERAKVAWKTRKPIFAVNCRLKEGAAKHLLSPVPVNVTMLTNGVIMASAETIQIFIADDDTVTTQQL